MEGKILLWIQQTLRDPAWDEWVLRLTSLNDKGAVAIAACLALLLIPKTRRVGAAASAALVSEALLVNLLLKPLFERVRPYEAVEGLSHLGRAMSDHSFPSGHTAAAFAVSVVMFRLLPRRWGVPALLLAGAIALSRLYVGVHYPTDVLGGAAVGTACALAACHALSRSE